MGNAGETKFIFTADLLRALKKTHPYYESLGETFGMQHFPTLFDFGMLFL